MDEWMDGRWLFRSLSSSLPCNPSTRLPPSRACLTAVPLCASATTTRARARATTRAGVVSVRAALHLPVDLVLLQQQQQQHQEAQRQDQQQQQQRVRQQPWLQSSHPNQEVQPMPRPPTPLSTPRAPRVAWHVLRPLPRSQLLGFWCHPPSPLLHLTPRRAPPPLPRPSPLSGALACSSPPQV